MHYLHCAAMASQIENLLACRSKPDQEIHADYPGRKVINQAIISAGLLGCRNAVAIGIPSFFNIRRTRPF
ncbi:hypothetical protein L5014_04310 [Paraburkholderia sp. RG36]|uniref:Uncharacterized protein n=1 Tax=Paraburkholderia tagetis TaxID=2913261 RepID=A0A9X1RPJ4_9BURK|nr:hypothetical protein [Paraburkholderia tagetis]